MTINNNGGGAPFSGDALNEDILGENIECLEDLGVRVDLEDLIDMSGEERSEFAEKLGKDLDLDETTTQKLIDDLDTELEDKAGEMRVNLRALKDMANQDDLSNLDRVTMEEIAKDLKEAIDVLNEGEISEDFSEEFERHLGLYIDLTNGKDHTLDGLAAKDGDEYVINASSGSGQIDGRGSAFDLHPDWIDTDGDGYGDREQILDANGFATIDMNNNKVIDERDLLDYDTPVTPQTITMNGSGLSSITLDNFDPSLGTATFTCIKDDGSTYKVTIQGFVDGRNPPLNLVFTGFGSILSPTTITDWPAILLQNTFDSVNARDTEMSIYKAINGPDVDGVDTNRGKFFSIYNMDEYHDEIAGHNLLKLEPSPTDFKQSREYTINFKGHTDDELILNLPDDAVTRFERDGEKLIMRITSGQGEIIVNLVGLERNKYSEFVRSMDPDFTYEPDANIEVTDQFDLINIQGGQVDLSGGSAETLQSFFSTSAVNDTNSTDIQQQNELLYMINLNDTPLSSLAETEGFNVNLGELDLNISPEDFAAGASYTVNFSPGMDQSLSLNLPEGAVISFEHGRSETGQALGFVIIATMPDGSQVRTHVVGLELDNEVYHQYVHRINISGGSLSEFLEPFASGTEVEANAQVFLYEFKNIFLADDLVGHTDVYTKARSLWEVNPNNPDNMASPLNADNPDNPDYVPYDVITAYDPDWQEGDTHYYVLRNKDDGSYRPGVWMYSGDNLVLAPFVTLDATGAVVR